MLRNLHIRYLLVMLAVVAPLLATSQVAASARADRRTIQLGDQLQLELQITYPRGTELRNVNDADLRGMDKLEVLRAGRLDTISRDPQYVLQQIYLLTSFDSGYHEIPPFAVEYALNGVVDTSYTNPIPIEVNTILGIEDSELTPIKPIIEEPLKFSDYLPYLIGGGVVALIILVALYFTRQRANIQFKKAPPPPPHEVAQHRLAQLAERELWQKGDIKTFQSELTFILRDYLEGRFQLPALESTTGQLDRILRRRTDLARWHEPLVDLLRTADLVKFAKSVPPVAVHQEGLDTVRAFVEATVPQPEPEEPETEATDQAEMVGENESEPKPPTP